MTGCDGAGTAEKSYPASEVRGGREETPCPEVRAAARRSYPTSEASGGREEKPRVRDQGWPGEATSRLRPGAVTLRSHPKPEARGSSCEEPPMPEAEEQPKQWWLRRHRRA